MNLRLAVLAKNEADFIRYADFAYYYYFMIRDREVALDLRSVHRKTQALHHLNVRMNQETYQLLQNVISESRRLLDAHANRTRIETANSSLGQPGLVIA